MKVLRTKNTGVPCLEQGTRGRAAISVLAEFSSEDKLELADAEEARTAVGGAGLPAEQQDDYSRSDTPR